MNGGGTHDRSRQRHDTGRFVDLLQKIEVFSGKTAVHPAGCNIGRCPAGHGASYGVEGIGGSGQLQPQHIAAQEEFVAVNGALSRRVGGRPMSIRIVAPLPMSGQNAG